MQKAQEVGQGGRRQALQRELCKTHDASQGKVLESRKHEDGVRRRRKCGYCGVIFYTIETVIAVAESPWKTKPKPKEEKPKKLNHRKKSFSRNGKRILTPRIVADPDFDKMSDEELEAWIYNGE